MAWGPAPCLTIWRNPRVLGFAGASRAATPEPEGRALIALVFSSLLCSSAAAAGAAAVFAFVASAVRHHQHAALAARRSAFMRIGQLRRSHSSGERSKRRQDRRGRNGSARVFCWGAAIELQIIGRNESSTQPPCNVIQYR